MSQEFKISKELASLIDNVVKKFPSNRKRSAVIESLLILQHDNHGYVTKDIIKALSNYLSVSEIDIYEVATFYTMINVAPVGKNVIAVCNNVSCMLRGSDEILTHIEQKLKIKVGESTSDNKFYLKDEIECLAACNGGPMMQINHKNYENLTLERVDKILEKFDDN
ncbi:MAG: NAD(P)H-dependent oxidoreductase subunit E [Gammaproteobacteria bacterium]|jgi:NADH-quinone oxidoreductase subunit E|nr:NAD(P)H-dependent oxidoreductase subunit E [Gammaproteobacteria bacterium]MBT4462953.1 NAD(P)H-dependent oxidoreductase subunit E [Gammaproteobacteria bacterium]MBT4654624.1 NAD(P)H-dependent oxidoreductase subunit E [Gammaproteobacteria bacterium]MBT5117065.1 NAD(P)H-dependent oxidoreductase subunit E [Gammaproteobacteria bacterium]MBT5761310.1 NAD(P)H-dependent oxidoreductase subunit E [Gammaproteobacteria bacterium]